MFKDKIEFINKKSPCQRDRCKGINFNGEYTVETNPHGKAVLTIDASITMPKKRDGDKLFNIFVVMNTSDNKMEGASN